MPLPAPTSLMAWADALDSMKRYGSGVDEPGGPRYVVMSDALARQLANVLRAAHPFVQPVQDLGEPA
jgi:hypothetical protein